jgi:hypothetical protein
MGLLLGRGLEGGNKLHLPQKPVDPDVDTFFGVMDTAGESYLASEVTMLDNLTTTLKNDGTWDLFTLLWFPVGAGVAEAMRALKHPDGIGTAMTNNGGNFVNADWDRTLGLDGRDQTANHYIDTLVTEDDIGASNDFHIGLITESTRSPALPGTGLVTDFGRAISRSKLSIQLRQGLGGYCRAWTVNYWITNRGTSGNAALYIAGREGNRGYYYEDSSNLGEVIFSDGNSEANTAGNFRLFSTSVNSDLISGRVISAAFLGEGVTDVTQGLINSAFQSARAERASIS